MVIYPGGKISLFSKVKDLLEEVEESGGTVIKLYLRSIKYDQIVYASYELLDRSEFSVSEWVL